MLTEILWYASWPLLIIIAVKMVHKNVEHFYNMEKLENIEKD